MLCKRIRRSEAKANREWPKVRSQWRKEAGRTFKEFSANPPPTGQRLRVFTDQGSDYVGTFDGTRFIQEKRDARMPRHESRFTACWTVKASGDVNSSWSMASFFLNGTQIGGSLPGSLRQKGEK